MSLTQTIICREFKSQSNLVHFVLCFYRLIKKVKEKAARLFTRKTEKVEIMIRSYHGSDLNIEFSLIIHFSISPSMVNQSVL